MVTDPPSERRKVEGSRENRGWKSVPHAASRGEETDNELITSQVGEFHTIMWVNDAWHMEHGCTIGGVIQAANLSVQWSKVIVTEKGKRTNLATKRQRVKCRSQEGITNQEDSFDSTLSRKEVQ